MSAKTLQRRSKGSGYFLNNPPIPLVVLELELEVPFVDPSVDISKFSLMSVPTEPPSLLLSSIRAASIAALSSVDMAFAASLDDASAGVDGV